MMITHFRLPMRSYALGPTVDISTASQMYRKINQ